MVRRGSVEELAEAMKTWANRRALDWPARQQLHERVAAKLSLERAAQDLTAIYESLLAVPPLARLKRA